MRKAVRIVSALLILMLLCSGCRTGTVEERRGTTEKSEETKEKTEETEEKAEETEEMTDADAAEESPGTTEKSEEPEVKIDSSVDADTAFELGNESYHSREYQEAEAYYRLAIEKQDDAERYCYGDMANNLVLTYLQLEKNQEAFELCHELLEKKAAPSKEDTYGYILNYMVCAHASGITAAEALKEAQELTGEDADGLKKHAEEDPGSYSKLMTALMYNAVYMDMEQKVLDPDFTPALPEVSAGKDWDMLKEEARKARDVNPVESALNLLQEEGSFEDKFKQLLKENFSKEEDPVKTAMQVEYLVALKEILVSANKDNKKIFGEDDPDLLELENYLDACMNALTEEKEKE